MRTPARVVVAAVLVLAVGVGTAAELRGTREGATGPSAASPTPQPTRSPLLPPAADAPLPTTVGLADAVTAGLADPALRAAASVSVVDATTGAELLDVRGTGPVLPASTLKLVTAAAVLAALPADTRLSTRALAGPDPGDVVLVGGGDVTLAGPAAPARVPAPARLADLAAQVVAARAGAPVTRVLVDDTLYGAPSPSLGPGWKPGYVTGGDVAPVSALTVDGGRVRPDRDVRVPDPAMAAGTSFAALLGVPTAVVARGVAPVGAAALGAVDSPPLPELVEQMLTRSDNDLAEALAHRLGETPGRPATFTTASAAVLAALGDLVPTGSVVPVDGSGLSRDDRVQPAAVAGLLSRVVRDSTGRFGAVLSGLPVAGFDGTLAARYRTGPTVPAAGQVRAKTGTLADVSALAGLVRTADGRLLAFDVTLNALPAVGTQAAQAALDRVATAFAGCGCR